MSALDQKQTSAPQKIVSALPPKADMCGAARDVRYGPKADKPHCSMIYSITSSALNKNVSEIVTPIALEVLELTTNSNLVGCSMGMSSGFVPRKMLSVISAKRAKSEGKLGP
jgi:hypothetical protein